MKYSAISTLKLLLFCMLLYSCEKGPTTVPPRADNNPGNIRLQAVVPGNLDIQLPRNSVDLGASGTYSNGGTPTLLYAQWSKISGPVSYTIQTPNQISTRINDLVAGIYVFQCRLTDQDGRTDSATTRITVIDPNNPPPPGTLDFILNPGSIETSFPFNSARTTIEAWYLNGDSPIIDRIQWRKIEGPSAYTITPAANLTTIIENLSGGTYVFDCKITDRLGESDSVTTVVSVCDTAKPVQQVTLNDQQWTDTGFGMFFRVNLSQYLSPGKALKEVYLKTDCASAPIRLFNIWLAPYNHSYTYFVEYFNNTIWLHIGYYTTGPDQCTLPVDTPDLTFRIQ